MLLIYFRRQSEVASAFSGSEYHVPCQVKVSQLQRQRIYMTEAFKSNQQVLLHKIFSIFP